MKACNPADTQRVHQRGQRVGLVFAGYGVGAVQIGRRQPVDGKHAAAVEVDGTRRRPDPATSPAAARGRAHDVAVSRDAALHDDRRRIRRAAPQVTHVHLDGAAAVFRRERHPAAAALLGEIRRAGYAAAGGTTLGAGDHGERVRLRHRRSPGRASSPARNRHGGVRKAEIARRYRLRHPIYRLDAPKRLRRSWHRRGNPQVAPASKGLSLSRSR